MEKDDFENYTENIFDNSTQLRPKYLTGLKWTAFTVSALAVLTWGYFNRDTIEDFFSSDKNNNTTQLKIDSLQNQYNQYINQLESKLRQKTMVLDSLDNLNNDIAQGAKAQYDRAQGLEGDLNRVRSELDKVEDKYTAWKTGAVNEMREQKRMTQEGVFKESSKPHIDAYLGNNVSHYKADSINYISDSVMNNLLNPDAVTSTQGQSQYRDTTAQEPRGNIPFQILLESTPDSVVQQILPSQQNNSPSQPSNPGSSFLEKYVGSDNLGDAQKGELLRAASQMNNGFVKPYDNDNN